MCVCSQWYRMWRCCSLLSAQRQQSHLYLVRLRRGRMNMTKRDYELIARCIAKVRTDYDADTALDALVLLICTVAREGNRRFNIERFKQACREEASLEQ